MSLLKMDGMDSSSVPSRDPQTETSREEVYMAVEGLP